MLEIREVVQGNSAAVKDLRARVDSLLNHQSSCPAQHACNVTRADIANRDNTATAAFQQHSISQSEQNYNSVPTASGIPTAFQQPKRAAPRRPITQTIINPLPVANRYTPLLVEDIPATTNVADDDDVTQPANQQTRQTRNNRRPNICCSENHLNNFHPIRPGSSTYAGAAGQGRRVFVLSDSMLQRIRKKEFNSNLRNGWAQIKSFPGANSKYLHHHVLPHLIEEHPHTLVIHGGTNDLRNRDKPASQIADELVSIAQTARSFGAENIMFSSIVRRSDGVPIDRKRNEVNRILREACTFFNFDFIDNDNVQLADIDYDRIHMCESGSVKIANNILNALNASQ